MSFNFKKILVIGATSGIGEALAELFVSQGRFVIIVGRRKDRLDNFVAKHGKDKVTSIVFDITRLDQIPQFASDITTEHPDLDCVVLNSGIQRGFDFSKPETINLSTFTEELTTNYTSYIHLTVAFLPHLQKQTTETSLVYISSGLGLVPGLMCPNYSATKAGLHSFVLVLREQMKTGPGNVKVIEIIPPSVQTELHDPKHQPHLKNVRLPNMPLKDFTEEAWAGLEKGDEQIAVGIIKMMVQAFENTRHEKFVIITDMMRKHLAQAETALPE